MIRRPAILIHVAVIFLAILATNFVNTASVSRRKTPPARDGLLLLRVASQKDVYEILRKSQIWGAHHIQVNRFLNMVDYFPKEEAHSGPFPIVVRDVRPLYEKGITDHNWLFIATRTGLIRRITTLMPESEFRIRVPEMMGNYYFALGTAGLSGYSYDTPWTITTLRDMKSISEPVIITIDAGYFDNNASPQEVADVLKRKCTDVRMMILVESRDESSVSDDMRRALQTFSAFWRDDQ